MQEPSVPKYKKPHKFLPENACGPWCLECRFYDRVFPLAFLIGVLCFLIYYITIAPPVDFPTASLLKVTPGESTAQVAQALEQKHLTHSPYLFEQGVGFFGNGTVIPGEYFFPSPQNLITVSKRLARGDYELIPIKVAIPEGLDNQQVSVILTNKIPDFDTNAFLSLSQPKEGYLFPDTYFFLPGENATTVAETMENNFQDHVNTFATTSAAFNKPLSQVVVMASLIEKEASDTKDRRIIAGILWHRIAIGMPLQVDAVFPYIIGVNSLQLTRQDLLVDSPYNTYTHKGLPPQPIVNPSLNSILAAETPIETKYVYYLSDLQGNFHFSVTYAQQLANEKKYLHE